MDTDIDPFAAVESLRAALDEVGIVLPSLAVDPATRLGLVDLGRVRAEVALRLAHALQGREAVACTATHEIPREVLRLLLVPSLGQQSDAQQRGAACVWDGRSPTAEAAVELGERRHRRLDGHYGTFPRGCASCLAERAHRALLDHGSTCSECADDRPICPVGRTLYSLGREARR